MGSTSEELEEVVKLAQSTEAEMLRSEHPQEKRRIEQPFYCGRFEVTQQEYLAVMEKNPSHFSAAQLGLSANRRPVETVTWQDAIVFCNRLSERDSWQPCYEIRGDEARFMERNGYRLPTEAEWEFACRAGSSLQLDLSGITGKRED